MWVVALGNAFDGLRLVGPFKDCDEAIEFVDLESTESWEIIEVKSPADDGDSLACACCGEDVETDGMVLCELCEGHTN